MGVLEGRERPWRRREDSFADVLNAVKPLLTRFCVAKSVTYPPNLPDLPRTSPKRTRPCIAKICFALYAAGTLGGSFFVGWGGMDFLQGAASRPIGEWGAIRGYALHECRDSACWRPFGVRLRGNGWFQRLPSHRCAAPLRMTQWGDFCVSSTI